VPQQYILNWLALIRLNIQKVDDLIAILMIAQLLVIPQVDIVENIE